MFSFGGDKGEDSGSLNPSSQTGGMMQSPLLNIDPKYLNQDFISIDGTGAARERTRFQNLCQVVGSTTCLGGAFGSLQSIRYTGLQLFKGQTPKRMEMTTQLLKNGSAMAQKFGAAAFLYCTCSIIAGKVRGVEDDFNTVIGGATAGGLYTLPGVLNVKKEGTEESMGRVSRAVRSMPKPARFFFGVGCGVVIGVGMALFRGETESYIKNITERR